MGNIPTKSTGDSSSSSSTQPKWKTGEKGVAIPSPCAGVDTFEKLMKFSDFKDYLSRNLDSDYLISSILADDVDSGAFVEGIEQFRTLSPTLREAIVNRIANFELMTVAGIDVSA